MKQAVMHSTSYQCQESFDYLQTLIEKSDSFRGKEEMRQALEKFKPNQEEDDQDEYWAQTKLKNTRKKVKAWRTRVEEQP